MGVGPPRPECSRNPTMGPYPSPGPSWTNPASADHLDGGMSGHHIPVHHKVFPMASRNTTGISHGEYRPETYACRQLIHPQKVFSMENNPLTVQVGSTRGNGGCRKQGIRGDISDRVVWIYHREVDMPLGSTLGGKNRYCVRSQPDAIQCDPPWVCGIQGENRIS